MVSGRKRAVRDVCKVSASQVVVTRHWSRLKGVRLDFWRPMRRLLYNLDMR